MDYGLWLGIYFLIFVFYLYFISLLYTWYYATTMQRFKLDMKVFGSCGAGPNCFMWILEMDRDFPFLISSRTKIVICIDVILPKYY